MNEGIRLKVDGAPSLDELRAAGMLPGVDELALHSCICIECVEEIPCNPCETSCPQAALFVGSPITNLPVIDRNKCTLCGLCIPACPGLAITMKGIHNEQARIKFPWEYLPLPKSGDRVNMVDRMGEVLCAGIVLSVVNPLRNKNTTVVTAEYPPEFINEVISMERNHERV